MNPKPETARTEPHAALGAGAPAERRPAHALAAFRMLLVLSVLTGVVYPFLVTGMAAVLFPRAARGSLAYAGNRPVGSSLIAQRCVSPRHFWARPSAGDDGTQLATLPSSASNLGLTSSNLAATVRLRVDHFRAAHGLAADAPVPADMAFASASGLDPHISPAAAHLQVLRVARARGLDAEGTERLRHLVDQAIEPPLWGLFGEPRVNVLHLNLQLDPLP